MGKRMLTWKSSCGMLDMLGRLWVTALFVLEALMKDYRILRSARKTIAIQITPAGQVLVRCPNRMKRAEIEAFVASKRGWIETHLRQIGPAPTPLTKGEVQTLAREAARILPGRAAHFAPLVGVSYGRITIRSQRTRWGSCSAKGNLNFNCLLMLAPSEIQDYVVVHELCHRKHMNHSDAFWAEVERILPDWREHRRWLRENGGQLIARLPGT